MKNGFVMTAAATVLAGVMVVGCDSKSDANKAAQTSQGMPSDATNQTPTTADKKTDNAMKDMGAQLKDAGDKAKDAGKSATDAMSAGMDKMKEKMGGGAATQPAMPSMPSMK